MRTKAALRNMPLGVEILQSCYGKRLGYGFYKHLVSQQVAPSAARNKQAGKHHPDH